VVEEGARYKATDVYQALYKLKQLEVNAKSYGRHATS